MPIINNYQIYSQDEVRFPCQTSLPGQPFPSYKNMYMRMKCDIQWSQDSDLRIQNLKK